MRTYTYSRSVLFERSPAGEEENRLILYALLLARPTTYRIVSSVVLFRERKDRMAAGITQIFNTFQDYLNTEQNMREVRIDVSGIQLCFSSLRKALQIFCSILRESSENCKMLNIRVVPPMKQIRHGGI